MLLRAAAYAFLARIMLGIRGRVRPYREVDTADVPSHVGELVERAAEPWRELGFVPLSWAEQGGLVLGFNPDRARHALVLFRDGDPRFVWLSIARAPDHGSATRATVVSHGEDGTQTETEGEIGAVESVRAPGHDVGFISGGSGQDLLDAHAHLAADGIPAAPDGVAGHLERRFEAEQRLAEHALATGQLRSLPDGQLEFGWRTALNVTWHQGRAVMRTAAQTTERRAAAAGTPPLPIEIEREQWEDHELLRARPLRRSFMLAVFAVTAILAVLSFSLWLSLPVLGILMVVLFVHELGHLVAMRLRGYGNTSIFFVPVFGAVASGRKDRASLSDEMIVLLAGPVPGLIAGLALYVAAHVQPIPPLLGQAAMMLVGVNAFNLLPLMPLDGGRIVHRLVADGRPRLEVALHLVSAVGLILSGLLLDAYLLAPLGVLFLLSLRGSSASAKLVTELRAVDLPASERRTAILRALRGPLGGAHAGARILRAMQLEKELDGPIVTRGARAGWLSCYVAILVSPLAIAVGPWHAHRADESEYVWLKCGESPETLDLGSSPRPIYIGPKEALAPDLQDELDVYGRSPCFCLPPPWIRSVGDADWRRRAAETMRSVARAGGAWLVAHPPPKRANARSTYWEDTRMERLAFVRTELSQHAEGRLESKLVDALLREVETGDNEEVCTLLQASEPCYDESPRLTVYEGGMMIMADNPMRDLETVTSFLCRRGVSGIWVHRGAPL